MRDQTYRILFDLAKDGLVVVSPEGRVREINRLASEGLGYAKEELIGMNIVQLVPADLAAELSLRIQEVLERGHLVFEFVAMLKDGSFVPVEVNARLIDLDGERLIFGAARDISERRTTEEAFVMTQIAVDRSNDSVFWLNMDGRILRVNDQACRSLGYSREELVGMHIWEIDRNRSASEVLGVIDGLRQQGSVRLESRNARKDGSTYPTEVVANYVRHRDKEWIISFARDISDRRSAEAAVRESEERLRQAVRVSHTGIFDHDHATDVLYWSPEQRAIYGMDAHEPVDLERFLSYLYPEDRERIAAAVRAAHDPDGRGLFDIDHRIIRDDGEVRWLMTRSQTFFDGEGEERHPTRTVGAVLDISERMRTEEKVAYLAFYDPLTGLANRRLLQERLDRALTSSARTREYGALLFIDLDHFKTINDTVGHDYGDLLLVEVAERLRTTLRGTDTISRPGGDEFVVILEQIGIKRELAAAQARNISEKVLEELSSRYHLQNREYSGSASIGVVLFRGHQDSVEELLKRSDMAMYEAKRAGRGTTRFFDPQMQSAFEERAKIETDIGKALQLRQFALHYQARVGRGGRVLGAEALLRWMHGERGLVLPGEFIPVCEGTRLILSVGEWVLESACAQLRSWQANPATRDLKVSVNISAGQFREDDFVERVARVLATTQVDPTRLELELTESSFLEDIEPSIDKMLALREMGVLFALDDFGIGYSSLSYLKKLPLSILKIDHTFVRDITTDKSDEIIVQTIIKMGQTLGLEVIAEGVETREQLSILEQHGCRNFQGFLFGRPIPAADFELALPA